MSRLLIVGFLGFGLLAQATLAGGTKTSPARTDAEFLQMAASGHNAEIQLGKLAESKSTNSEVKAFATHLVKEHQAAYAELAKLLKIRNLGVIAGLEKENRDDAKRLADMTGTEFDQEFLSVMVRHHERAENLYDAHAKQGEQVDVRDYAKTTLPALRHHLNEARKLQKSATK